MSSSAELLRDVATHAMPARVIVESLLAGLAPDPALTVAEWADAKRMLPAAASAEPGPYRTERTPYAREIMESLSPSAEGIEVVVWIKGAQVGATEVGNNWIGYNIDHRPSPQMFVQPTLEMAKRTSRQRLSPMIQDTPALREKVADARSRDGGNTVLVKEYPGGLLVITGANSAVGLRSMSARDLFLDEVDAYELDIDGEGDPIELAFRRTATYGRARKVFLASTPTVADISRIERAYLQGDRRKYFVPCPECGDMAPIEWDRITYRTDTDGVLVEGSVGLVCEECGVVLDEGAKTALLAGGEWRATAKPRDPRVRSFHTSALYSPLGWYSWADAVRDYLKAKRAGPEGMKTWTNTVLGLPYSGEGEAVDEHELLARREEYAAEVPAGAMVLTAGVDVQADRVEVTVDGWGLGEQRWTIDHRIIYGDFERREVQEQLDALLFGARWQHESGLALRIMATAIDAGFKATAVYDYVKRRGLRNVFAVKGVDGEDKPIVGAPSRKRTGRNKRPVPLYTVGTHAAKSTIYSRLKIESPGAGFHHLPARPEIDLEWCEQLAAERLQTKLVRGFPKRSWIKTRPRNEALDCSVYSLAALLILNPVWSAVEAHFQAQVARASEAEDETPKQTPQTKRRRRGRRRGNFVTGG